MITLQDFSDTYLPLEAEHGQIEFTPLAVWEMNNAPMLSFYIIAEK